MGSMMPKSQVPTSVGRHAPQPLRFDPGKLRGLSEKLIRSHWADVYCHTVEALNAIEQRLAVFDRDGDVPLDVYADLKREELQTTTAVLLHELYFGNLGGDGNAPDDLKHLLSFAFGSFERWLADFRRAAVALSGCSGWTILAATPDGSFHNYCELEQVGSVPGIRPILVLDMDEHAYRLDHGSAAAPYVDAFMQNIDWDEVRLRLVRRPGLEPRDTDTWTTTSTPG